MEVRSWPRVAHRVLVSIRPEAAVGISPERPFDDGLKAKVGPSLTRRLHRRPEPISCLSRHTALMNQINVVMLLARADMGLGGDVEKLNEQSHEMSKRPTEAVNKLKEEHEREMEAMRQLFR
jgi:hypothetical protein